MDSEEPVVIKKKRHSRLMRLRLWLACRSAIRGRRRGERAFAAVRATIEGTFPAPGSGTVLLAACNDYYYWNFAVTMLRSIEALGARERFHLHLCSPSAEALENAEALARELRVVELTVTRDDGSIAAGLPYPTIWYASVRFVLAGPILKATGATVLCLDIDGIARKPISAAFEAAAADRSDAVLIKRPEERNIARKILASAAAFRPTPAGRRFATVLANAVASALALKPRYHVDQIVIHDLVTLLEKQGTLAVSQMPKQLADFEFGEDAVVWTAKGWHRKKSQAYTQAMESIERSYGKPAGTSASAPTEEGPTA